MGGTGIEICPIVREHPGSLDSRQTDSPHRACAMVAYSALKPRQLTGRDALLLSGIAAFCFGFCLVIRGLWAGPIVNEAVAAPLGAASRDLADNLTMDVAGSAGAGSVDQAPETTIVTPSTMVTSSKATLGVLVPPLPDFAQNTLKSRSLDTRDWLFIVSWQVSRGEHGGMRAAAVAPSTHQGKKRYDTAEARTGRPRS